MWVIDHSYPKPDRLSYLVDSPSYENQYAEKLRLPKAGGKDLAHAAFVDWLCFTFPKLALGDFDDDWDYVRKLHGILVDVLGFGVAYENSKGRHFYQRSYVLGENWGLLCIGGQHDTLMVLLNGSGCAASTQGWEQHMRCHLQHWQARITRIDLAADFYQGQYTVDKALSDYTTDQFSQGARRPRCDQRGDWVNTHDTRGRTFYVGARGSGKFLRVYEKGKQLGGAFGTEYPNWTRVELELGARGRVIPFEVLRAPGEYLAGSYPALGFINAQQTRIRTQAKQQQTTISKAKHVLKRQFGRVLYTLTVMAHHAGKTADELLDELSIPEFPERLITPYHRLAPVHALEQWE